MWPRQQTQEYLQFLYFNSTSKKSTRRTKGGQKYRDLLTDNTKLYQSKLGGLLDAVHHPSSREIGGPLPTFGQVPDLGLLPGS